MTVLDLAMTQFSLAAASRRTARPADMGRFGVRPPIELCLVVPTFNERQNLRELFSRVEHALVGVEWEMILVDDNSPDGTAAYARDLRATDRRVRVIRRIGRRGLSSACVEGMLASDASFFAVMDADLQHDPKLLSGMVQILREGQTDLVCASRHMPGGSIGAWSGRRAATSRLATWLARSLTDIELTDPMSGFFAVRRELIDRWAPRLSCLGFKLLLDIVLTVGPGLGVREVPLRFGMRRQGVSKLSPKVAWDYGLMLADKTIGHVIPPSMIGFLLIGSVGLILHMLTFGALVHVFRVDFQAGQIAASLVAIGATFVADSLLAHDSHEHRGAGERALASLAYFASCAVGVVGNVAIASILIGWGLNWPLAALGGAVAGMICNEGAGARCTGTPSAC